MDSRKCLTTAQRHWCGLMLSLSQQGMSMMDTFYIRHSWQGAFPLHINHKETITLEPTVIHWGHLWSDRRVIIYCDNQAVGILNKGSCRDTIVIASPRRLAMQYARYNFRIHFLDLKT